MPTGGTYVDPVFKTKYLKQRILWCCATSCASCSRSTIKHAGQSLFAIRILVQVTLLGHFNGQGLGRSVQDFVSKELIVDPSRGARPQQGATSIPPKEEEHGVGNRDSSAELAPGSSTVDNDVQVIVRTTPGVEYIKVIIHESGVARCSSCPSLCRCPWWHVCAGY